jgi:dTDP-4-dehydrorhamnose reductase
VVDLLADPLRARRVSVVVTGGGGQLAADLAAAFDGDAWVPPRAELDVGDRAAVERAFAARRPQLVLHAAAWTDVDGAESDPAGAYRANLDGCRNVARAARALGARLVAYSTDYVFPGDAPDGYVESDPVGPRSVYGASKLAGELVTRAEHPDAWIVRTAWVFSPRGRNFVLTMLRLAAERDTLRVVDDQRGCPTYSAHLAAATRTLIDRCPPGVYHLAGGGSCSWRELAEAIVAARGLPARVEPITSDELARPAPRPACSVLRSEHECTPALPHWRQGLEDCLEVLSR